MEPITGRTYANSIYEYLVTLPIDPTHDHGEIFHYQTPKTDVVNWVTNRVTGKSFQDNLYEKLWSQLGTDGETYVLLDKNANLFAGGGLNASPYDLARFASMMINGGQFSGKQIVPSSVIQKLSEGASTEAFANGPEAKGIMDNGDWSYRAQWWVRHTPGKEAFTAIGIHGQWIYIDVTRNIAIVKQSSQPDSSTDHYTAYDIHGFDAVINYLSLFSDSVTLTGKQKCHLDYIQGFGKISAPPRERREKPVRKAGFLVFFIRGEADSRHG